MCGCTVKDIEKLGITSKPIQMICHTSCGNGDVGTVTNSNNTNGVLFYDAETGKILNANTQTK